MIVIEHDETKINYCAIPNNDNYHNQPIVPKNWEVDYDGSIVESDKPFIQPKIEYADEKVYQELFNWLNKNSGN